MLFRSATDLTQVKTEGEQTIAQRAAAAGSTIIVQLATYLSADCSSAQQEITGYGGKFVPPPSLWRDAGAKYVVVGIKAASLDQAASLRQAAINLASDPSQKGNDLAHAKVRVDPGWTPLAACPQQ